MLQRLWVLVLAELLVILLLALQVFGGSPDRGGQASTGMARSGDEGLQAVQSAPGEGVAQPPTDVAGTGARGERVAVAAKWNPDDKVGILLQGTLRSRDGSVVKDPSVYVGNEQVGRSAAAVVDGAWAVTGLQPGEWSIHVRADGFAALVSKHTLTDEAVQQVDLVLDPSYPVRVRIETPDGKDANAWVARELGLYFGFHVVGSKDPIPDHLAATDYSIVFVGDANWKREDRPKDGTAGVLELAAPPPAYAAVLLRHLVLAQQRIEPDQREVKFVVDPAAAAALTATVRMRLVDGDTAEPVADGAVTLRTSSGGGAHGKSDAAGNIVVEHALAGLLILELYAKDHEQVTTTIRVQPGDQLDLGELRLGKPNTLRGRVLDADGKPAAASVQWTELKWRSGPRPFNHNRSAGCDADGRFELGGVGPGLCAITARAQDGRIAVAVASNPQSVPVELRLLPAAQVLFTRKLDPSQAFTITVFDGQKQPVGGWRFERGLRSAYKLPPGNYSFEVHDDSDRLVRSGQLQLGAEPVTIDL